MTPTKSLQINLGVFEATDSVRKSVAAYGDNFASSSGTFRETKTAIAAGQTHTLEGLKPSSCTVIRVSRPVQLRILKDATDTSPSTDLTLLVRRLIVLDDTYSRITVTALGYDVYMTAQQA